MTPQQIVQNALRMLRENDLDREYILNGLPEDGTDAVRFMGVDFFRHPDGKWRMYPAAKNGAWPFDEA